MKTRLVICIVMLAVAAVSITSCKKKDESPKTVPVVTTSAVTSITTTSATGGGQITDGGNAAITSRGLAYSSLVSTPTIADDKIDVTTNTANFSGVMENLNSGTTYHVRAYATNEVGTAYGSVVDFTTGNAAPVATNVTITGIVEVGMELTGTYTFGDSDGDGESGSTFQWYVAIDGVGTGETAIAGATELTYTIQASQQGKFIRIGVTPKAASGDMIGEEVKSTFVGAVGEATTVTFMYHGQEVTYGIINSPTVAGRKWLDRNLGAPNVAVSATDFANFGDLFQWGRLEDGHQLIVRTGPNDTDASGVNGTTSPDLPYQYSNQDNPGHSLFIIIPNGTTPTDWRDPQNDNLWQGVNGVNNPCPAGWRIATQSEWEAENITDMTNAYDNLNLTFTGFRSPVGDDAGAISFSADGGLYWTTTLDSGDPTQAVVNFISGSGYFTLGQARAVGMACRCIKD